MSPDGTGPIRAGAAVPGRAGDGDGTGPEPGGRNNAGAARVAATERGGAPGVPEKGVTETPEGGLAELRHKMRTQRRLRVGVLSALAAMVLLVLPAFFGIRAITSDPVFASLNALNVPSWATQKAVDEGNGSRWCFLDCRFWERMAESERPPKETAAVYTGALKEAGWQSWEVANCPDNPVNADEGSYTCWRRDELTLDLYVSLPGCAVEQVIAVPEGEEGTEEQATGPVACEGSTVSIKVRNAITDERGKKDTNPGPIGVTPDPVLPTDDSLLSPTPEAS
jgi:hypothetical protein